MLFIVVAPFAHYWRCLGVFRDEMIESVHPPDQYHETLLACIPRPEERLSPSPSSARSSRTALDQEKKAKLQLEVAEKAPAAIECCYLQEALWEVILIFLSSINMINYTDTGPWRVLTSSLGCPVSPTSTQNP